MNTITYIIIGAIIILMAIIGYIADKNKKPKQEKKQIEPSPETLNQGAQTWSENAKPKDERQETVHKVPTVDDWSTIPTNTGELPEVQLENPNLDLGFQNNDTEPMFPDIKETDLEIPEIPASEPQITAEPENLNQEKTLPSQTPEVIPTMEQTPVAPAPALTPNVETPNTEPQPIQTPETLTRPVTIPQVETTNPIEPTTQTPVEPQIKTPVVIPEISVAAPTPPIMPSEPVIEPATVAPIINQTPQKPAEVPPTEPIPQPNVQMPMTEPKAQSAPVQTPIINQPSPAPTPTTPDIPIIEMPETPTEPQGQNQTSIWN